MEWNRESRPRLEPSPTLLAIRLMIADLFRRRNLKVYVEVRCRNSKPKQVDRYNGIGSYKGQMSNTRHGKQIIRIRTKK